MANSHAFCGRFGVMKEIFVFENVSLLLLFFLLLRKKKGRYNALSLEYIDLFRAVPPLYTQWPTYM